MNVGGLRCYIYWKVYERAWVKNVILFSRSPEGAGFVQPWDSAELTLRTFALLDRRSKNRRHHRCALLSVPNEAWNANAPCRLFRGVRLLSKLNEPTIIAPVQMDDRWKYRPKNWFVLSPACEFGHANAFCWHSWSWNRSRERKMKTSAVVWH